MPELVVRPQKIKVFGRPVGGCVAEDSKGDRVPFGTRLCWQSLVCYTFMKQTEYGNGEFPSDERSISVFSVRKVAPVEGEA